MFACQFNVANSLFNRDVSISLHKVIETSLFIECKVNRSKQTTTNHITNGYESKVI